MEQPLDLEALAAGEGGEELYRSDSFRMQAMKVLPCSKRYVHDWTECPFAHPQEKARRRDPRLHNYTGIACPSMKKEGCCAFGDHCPYAHNVFEYWLHPTRYRTQLCNDGSNCKRKICFFAHSLDELRVPACKPFVSPEALAAAAAAAAADAEAKRKAATIGSPLSAFAALSPGPSPQRNSLEALRAAQVQAAAAAGDPRMSAAGSAPPSPLVSDESAARALSGSPAVSADSAVQAALAQLSGAGFSNQEQQVIEVVTGLLAQDRVSPEQAATLLQQMLAPATLNQLQAHLNTPRASEEHMRSGRFSDPLSQASPGSYPPSLALHNRASSFDAATAAAAVAASPVGQPTSFAAMQTAPGSLSLETMAAMQAAQALGIPYHGGIVAGQLAAAHDAAARDAAARKMSLDSLRSSFDTGAGMPASSSRRSSTDSEPGAGQAAGPNSAAAARLAAAAAAANGVTGGSGGSSTQREQQQQQEPAAPAGQQPRQQGSPETAPAAANAQQQAALYAACQQQYQQAVVRSLLMQQHQRTQLLQPAAAAAAAVAAMRGSEESSRMSFETGGRGSVELLVTPRGSVDSAYPQQLVPTLSGSLSGQFYGNQLSSVPEAFPMINAPPPSNSWSAGSCGRFSLDSAADRMAGAGTDRLSAEMARLSFEASPKVAPQPTANPYASSLFAPGTAPMASASAPAASMGIAERRSLSLPPLPPVRTTAPARAPSAEDEGSATAAAAAAAAVQQQAAQQAEPLVGGTAVRRLA